MTIELEKDTILKKALEEIMEIRIEGQLINKDYLNYWSTLNQSVMHIATSSFRTGIKEFYNLISINDKKKELVNYNFRVLTHLSNSTVVSLAADSLYKTFSEVILERQGIDIEYDMVINGEICALTKFEKILLLMHIYQDKLDSSFSMHYKALSKKR